MSCLLTERAATWLALILFVLVVVRALLVHRPLRRALAAAWVFGGAALRYLGRRLRGEGLAAGPREWRLAFERLGPTYIKLGQIIASSTTLFPQRYVAEFRLCLDRVPPEPWHVVRDTICEALGHPPEELFAQVCPTPLASASIAQVHAARGQDDQGHERDLVIKVQRRGLPEQVDADIRILGVGAALLQQLPHLRNANPRGIVQAFDRSIHEELDFLAEAAHMDEFNRILRQLGRDDVCAPQPVWRLCTRTVLTMERLHGISVDDVEALRRRGYPQEWIEERLIAGMHAWFQTLIRYGFFHGDVHAGNLLLLDDGRIGFLDFGIVGRFSPERRRQIADYLVAFASQDFCALARVMVRMGVVDPEVAERNLEAFAEDLRLAYGPLARLSLSEIDYGDILPQIMQVSLRHGTRLPDDFVLVTRQLLYFDRYARLLAPSLNVFGDPRLAVRIAGDLAALG
ncbi:MAG: AarF/UbiB family protein [Myxococcales bacterium]|nr:AarF/UbiB family protein [Myxococcota bacterium]MDW8284239.1 AarF/UbiB family protein [Myxococcales bacterium]